MKIPEATRPPLEGDQAADVCILGAGMTGCAAALELARLGRRVVVLEASSVASGASGRNFGHVATGLGIHYAAAIEQLGREGAREVWETHRENHARLRELIQDLRIDCGYEARGGFSVAETREEARILAESEDLLRDDGFSGEFFDHYMFEARFDVTGFAGAYWAADDAEIDSTPFVLGLARAAEARGAVIYERSPVLDLDLSSRGVEAVTARGRVRADLAFIALNAHAPRLVPFFEGRIAPIRGQCLRAEVGPDANLPSPAYSDHGNAYWRKSGSELLVGGFDQLSPKDEATDVLGTTTQIQAALEEFVSRHFPTVGPVRVAERWSGIMGIAADGFPFVGSVPGLPAVAACGFTGLGYGYAFLAAQWAVTAAVTGRDPTPVRYRASRPVVAGGIPPWRRPTV